MKKLITDDPVYCLHEYGLDLANLEIYMQGTEDYIAGCGTDDPPIGEPCVDYTMSNKFIKNLRACMLNGKDGKNYKPILIHMKTCGGDWEEGMAIYDAIKACPNPVVILSYTHARSMSSIILQACDKRVLMPTSSFMYHCGDGVILGTEKQIRSQIEFQKKDIEIMLDIYAKQMRKKGMHKGKSLKKLREYLVYNMDKNEEVYLTAEQAVNEGFADEVFNGNWDKLKEIK